MITKAVKQELVKNIKDKEEKIKLSNVIDKCNKSEATSKITTTNFLDLYEKSIISSMLNKEKIKYEIYFPNSYCEKCIVMFLPEYMSEEHINYNDYVSCIRISAKDMSKLKHKDFMGSIYSLGIKNEYIGDIFLKDKYCYVYVCSSIEEYILDNLFKVANQEVKCEKIDVDSKEAKELKIEYITKSYIVPSRRIDALLSEVYSIGRKEAKEKIVEGDLYINSKICTDPAQYYNYGDIVSFRKCGKLKIGNEIRKTKSGNICIEINKYK